MVKKQRSILLIVMLLVFFSSGVNTFAASQKVYDKAGLFSDSQRAALEKNASALAEKLKLDIAIVTTKDAQNKTSREYADDFYDNNGFGYGANRDGLLLLINMQDREVYISTCGSGIQYFTDDRINSMLDKIYIYLKDGNYSGGAAVFLSEVERYVQLGIPSNQYTQEEGSGTPQYTPDGNIITPSENRADSGKMILIYLGISLAAGAIVVGIMAMYNKGTKTTNQNTYLDENSFNIINSQDYHYDTRVTSVIIQNNSNHSGGSTTHSSGGGSTHGGGGRKF